MQLDIPILDIISGIQNFELTKNRMEIHHTKNDITIINDTYNASYDSMKAGLEYLGKYSNQRKIAVLGDMLALGDFSEQLHEDVGKEVTKNNIDILITVGKESAYIWKGAINSGFDFRQTYCLDNNNEAIEKLNEILQPNDVVFLKASHGMNFIEIVNKIKEDF